MKCLKTNAKASVLRLAAWGGLFSFGRYRSRRAFRVLAYHGVSASIDARLNYDGFFVSPSVFESHLQILKRRYHVMPLSDMVRAVQEGRALPDHAVAITFDDGYLNNYEEAAPLLDHYGLPATFFVTIGFVDGTCAPWWWRVREVGSRRSEVGGQKSEVGGRKLKGYVRWCVEMEREMKNMASQDRSKRLSQIKLSDPAFLPTSDLRFPTSMMSWSQIRDLVARGHEVGGHTVSHISLGHESMETIEAEVAGSLERIRDEVGQVSPVYSYPYGEATHFTPAIADILRRHGCIGGVTTLEGANRPDTDPFFLRRFNITGNHDRYAFRALASGLRSCLRGSK